MLILSFIAVLFFSFIPEYGVRVTENTHFYGIPAEWLGLHNDGNFSLMLWGFLLNMAFFYFVWFLTIKLIKKVASAIKKGQSNK